MSRLRISELQLRREICALVEHMGSGPGWTLSPDAFSVQSMPESRAWCNWEIPPATMARANWCSTQVRAIRLAIAAARERFNVEWPVSLTVVSHPVPSPIMANQSDRPRAAVS